MRHAKVRAQGRTRSTGGAASTAREMGRREGKQTHGGDAHTPNDKDSTSRQRRRGFGGSQAMLHAHHTRAVFCILARLVTSPRASFLATRLNDRVKLAIDIVADAEASPIAAPPRPEHPRGACGEREHGAACKGVAQAKHAQPRGPQAVRASRGCVPSLARVWAPAGCGPGCDAAPRRQPACLPGTRPSWRRQPAQACAGPPGLRCSDACARHREGIGRGAAQRQREQDGVRRARPLVHPCPCLSLSCHLPALQTLQLCSWVTKMGSVRGGRRGRQCQRGRRGEGG